MALTDELQEISGIGPAKAEQIEAIVAEHETDSECVENVEEALGYLDEGQPDYARKFLKRVVE